MFDRKKKATTALLLGAANAALMLVPLPFVARVAVAATSTLASLWLGRDTFARAWEQLGSGLTMPQLVSASVLLMLGLSWASLWIPLFHGEFAMALWLIAADQAVEKDCCSVGGGGGEQAAENKQDWLRYYPPAALAVILLSASSVYVVTGGALLAALHVGIAMLSGACPCGLVLARPFAQNAMKGKSESDCQTLEHINVGIAVAYNIAVVAVSLVFAAKIGMFAPLLMGVMMLLQLAIMQGVSAAYASTCPAAA